MFNDTYRGPYYRYDIPKLQETLRVANEAAVLHNCEMKYAIKANNEKRIVKEIKKAGLGVDCVSAEEIEFALEQGWSNENIVFAGSGKTIREIHYALSQNIAFLHCESFMEWEIVRELIDELGSTTQIALRINPDVKVDTHAKISTGEKHHKFGMSFQEALEIIHLDQSIVGFHFHVGSQILDMQYFEDLSLKVRSLLEQLPTNFNLTYLNMGGGLGINYDQPERFPIPDFNGWMAAVRSHLPESLIPIIYLEPGRSIVGQCGQLIGEVQYIKNENTHPIAILDVGMTEILRPALYGSRHKISTNSDSLITESYTVSGPSCESSDTFGNNFELPTLQRGDLVTIHSTGAYGSSMRLSYNLRKALPVKYVTEDKATAFKASIRKVA
jgi:diaminopimelate decarboxylase